MLAPEEIHQIKNLNNDVKGFNQIIETVSKYDENTPISHEKAVYLNDTLAKMKKEIKKFESMIKKYI